MAAKPSIPKGTRDFSPVEMAKRNYIFNTIRDVYHLYGFQQIETPSMEMLSTLMGKYGDEGDTFGFQIFLDGVHITHRQGCEVAILIEAVKNDRTDQIPLPHQLDNLFRIVTEAQRLVLRDADTLICFVEASQNVRRIVRTDNRQIQNRRGCGEIRLCTAKLVLHCHVHD